MLDHLELADRLAQGFTLARPLEALFQRKLRGHVGHQGQGQAFVLEIAHDAGETHVFAADQIAYRHWAIIEEQFGRVRRPPAHFLQLPPHGETRGALLDQQQADAGETRLTGAHRDGVVIRAYAAGDERFTAADPVEVAFTHGAGLQVGDVGTAAGFGDGQGADFLAGQHLRHHPITHARPGPLDYRRQADVQGAQPRHQATRATAHQLFAGGDLGEYIPFVTAAQALRVANAENPRRTGLEVELAGKAFGFFPLVNVRKNLALNETPDAVADHLVAGVEVFLKGRHGRAPLKGSAKLTERLLGFQQE